MHIHRLHASGALSGPYQRRSRRIAPELWALAWLAAGAGLLVLLFAR
jgi:hypothetical protein